MSGVKPIYTEDIMPIPESLLKIVFCSCKGNCTKQSCGCRKHGLKCTEIFKNCHGQSCENDDKPIIEELSNDLEEFIESIMQNTYVVQDKEDVEELIPAKKHRIE